MDGQNYVSRQAEQDCLAANSLGKQTTDVIESVANKLAIIGDDLNQSYELPYYCGSSQCRQSQVMRNDRHFEFASESFKMKFDQMEDI